MGVPGEQAVRRSPGIQTGICACLPVRFLLKLQAITAIRGLSCALVKALAVQNMYYDGDVSEPICEVAAI